MILQVPLRLPDGLGAPGDPGGVQVVSPYATTVCAGQRGHVW